MKSSKELLKDALKDPKVIKYLKNHSNHIDRKGRYVQKMRSIIEPMSNAEFLKFVDRICKREEVFEERCYKKGIITTSNIFDILFDAVSQKEYSRPCNNEMFLAEKYIYKGLTFKLYVGQGCFYRITMGKRLIFNSN